MKKISIETEHRNNNEYVDLQLSHLQENIRRSWWNSPKRWFFSLLAISVLLSYISILKLGEGGDVTFLSMLTLCIIGYIIDPKAGLLAAFLFGIIKYIISFIIPGYAGTVLEKIINDPGWLRRSYDILHTSGYHACRNMPEFILAPNVDVFQLIGDLFDYLIGYTLLGAFGFLEGLYFLDARGKHHIFTLQNAFLFAVFLRFIESVANYVIFYPEPVAWYRLMNEALTYSLMYVIAEGLISWIILFIPSVIDTIQYFRTVAHNKYNENIYQGDYY